MSHKNKTNVKKKVKIQSKARKNIWEEYFKELLVDENEELILELDGESYESEVENSIMDEPRSKVRNIVNKNKTKGIPENHKEQNCKAQHSSL